MVQQTEHHLLAERSPRFDRFDVLEGPTGRRSWPDAVKARVVLESFQPGARVGDVARRNGVAPQHLSTWRRLARDGKLGPLAVEPAFADVVVAEAPALATPPEREPTPTASAPAWIEIAIGAITLRLPAASAPERIAAVVAALRATA